MDRSQLPVGVFDSGVGGVSVLRELVRILPQEDFYFFGDSANAPYGTKSPSRIMELTLSHVDWLSQRGVKAIVIACNTATSAAIGPLRRLYHDQMPVIGIEPALKPAVMRGENPRVLVMATPGTVHGEKYRRLMERYRDRARITALGCPGLMEFVERGQLEGEQLMRYLETLLAPYRDGAVDAVVLGCTHYPFVRRAIREVIGRGPVILDGSLGTARELEHQLKVRGLLREPSHQGKVIFHLTLPGREKLCQRLLAEEIGAD